MALYIATRLEVIDEIVAELRELHAVGRTVIAVDAIAELGQRAFADDLVARLNRAGSRAWRADIAGITESDWRRALYEPFRMGGSTGFVLQVPVRDDPAAPPTSWTTGPRDGYLVITGTDLLSPELADSWHYSILLVSEATPSAEDRPFRQRAKVTIAMTDPEHPKRLFADSC